MPILEGLDGAKMSKSLNNHIGILDSPNDMFKNACPFQIVICDDLLTNITPELSAIETQLNNGENPRNIKLALATTIVSEFHSTKDAALAKEAHQCIFKSNTK